MGHPLRSAARYFLATTGMFIIFSAAANKSQAETQEAMSQDDTSITLQTIQVQAYNPENIPAAVSSISSNEINEYGRENLNDVLRVTPGVFTSINSSNPGVAVNIRGLEGAGRVNMMIDGVPQTFRTTGHDAQGYSYIDPNLVSTIDIARGAVTTEGGGALAGSANFRTLGVDDILLEGKDKGVLSRISWGSNGVGFSEMFAGAARVNNIGIAAAISHRDSNDYKNGDGDIVDKTGQKLLSGLFKTEFTGDEHKLSLGGIIYNNKYGTYASYGAGIPPILTDLLVQNRTVTANYNYKPLDNQLIDLSVNAYYNYTKLTYVKGSQDSDYGKGTNGREITNKMAGLYASNTSLIDFSASELALKYGFEYSHENTGGKEERIGPNPINSKVNKGALFTEAGWTYDRLNVLGGLRYDFYNLKNDESGLNNKNQLLNPKLTVAYQLTDWMQPYVTYAHSMRAPSLQETMFGGIGHGSNTTYRGNPDLDPEKQRGWELGVNIQQNSLFSSDDKLRLKANYYNMRIEDYIVATTFPEAGTTSPKTYTQYINIDGTSRVSGFELEANYDAGFVFGGITYTHANSDLPQQHPNFGSSQHLPKDIVAVTAGARFFEEKLETGVRYQHVSSATTTSTDKPKSAPYDLVDIFATYKLNENADLSFQVTNLFNKTYTPALSTYGSGQGRTFILSTQFQF